MKNFLTSKTIVALAVAIATSAANVSNAYEQPIPPPATADNLPANIAPGSDLAQVFKLAQANVELSVIKNFIANSRGSFDLDAAKIIALNDAGVPSTILDLMLEHDRQFSASAQTPPSAPPTVVTTVETAPPAAPVSVTYFNQTLSPYGNWIEVEGYGRCWRPTTVVYDSNWSPYCDRGHWVSTDCGWYWDSDYAWGSTFHYGRWFRDSRAGWCWWPDTTWAPSWVVWRSGQDHCGWAPLPPRSYYRPERGFFYNGSSVSIGFDFGLREDCFTFVSLNHFSDRHLRDYREDSRRSSQYYHNTTIINNYNYGGPHNTIINNGISVDRVSAATHRPVRTIAVNELPNAQRQGWRGEGRHDDRSNGSINSNNGQRQPGNGAQNANGGVRTGGTVGAPVIISNEGQRGHGNAFGNSRQPASGSQTGNPSANPAANSSKVYTPEAGREPSRPTGSSMINPPMQNQNQHVQPSGGGQREQHSSRMDQQSSRGQNQATTPTVITTAPQRSQPQVEQPQIIHPQTPAQMGQVLGGNNHSSRLDQPRNQTAGFINTAPPQRSEIPVQQPQIVRPTVSGTVLQPSPGRIEQRIQPPAENRVNPFQNRIERNVERNVERAPTTHYQTPAQAQAQPQAQNTERAAQPASRSNGDNHKSDKDKK